MQTSFGHNNK